MKAVCISIVFIVIAARLKGKSDFTSEKAGSIYSSHVDNE